jgi:hypothetical protein
LIVVPNTQCDDDNPVGAMNVTPTPGPESVQSVCLAPARLDQPGVTAQVCDGKDAFQNEDSKDLWGKSASCTTIESLHSELKTLKDSIPATLRAIITFERQSVQMFFSPDHALEDFRRKVKELWNIPMNHYFLKINGMHEDVTPQIWGDNTTVRVEIKGLLGGTKPPPDRIKIHLKIDEDPKIYAFTMKADSTLEEVSDLVSDVFGRSAKAALFQGNAQLDLADSLRDWITSTRSKSEITLGADIDFKGDETIERLPIMETTFEGKIRWIKNDSEWRKMVEESHGLEGTLWSLDKPSQTWEDGAFNIIL